MHEVPFAAYYEHHLQDMLSCFSPRELARLPPFPFPKELFPPGMSKHHGVVKAGRARTTSFVRAYYCT